MPDKQAMPTLQVAGRRSSTRFTRGRRGSPGADDAQDVRQPDGLLNGNLATGLFAPSWFVRLSEADGRELLAAGGGTVRADARPADARLHPLPAGSLDDAGRRRPWVDRAIDHVSTLPPK